MNESQRMSLVPVSSDGLNAVVFASQRSGLSLPLLEATHRVLQMLRILRPAPHDMGAPFEGELLKLDQHLLLLVGLSVNYLLQSELHLCKVGSESEERGVQEILLRF